MPVGGNSSAGAGQAGTPPDPSQRTTRRGWTSTCPSPSPAARRSMRPPLPISRSRVPAATSSGSCSTLDRPRASAGVLSNPMIRTSGRRDGGDVRADGEGVARAHDRVDCRRRQQLRDLLPRLGDPLLGRQAQVGAGTGIRHRLAPPPLPVITRRRPRGPAEERDARPDGEGVLGRGARARGAVDVDPEVRAALGRGDVPRAAERHERHAAMFEGPELAPPTSHPADQPSPGPRGRVPLNWRELIHT